MKKNNYAQSFVISTERKNHTRNSAKIGDLDCGIFSVISPFSRNDKLCTHKKIQTPTKVGIWIFLKYWNFLIN